MSELFDFHMKELENGIIFQLQAVMKTFTNDEIDKAFEVLNNPSSPRELINDYVLKINFLSKDYLEDVDNVKKFSNLIAKRTQKAISKTAKKVELLLNKMQ